MEVMEVISPARSLDPGARLGIVPQALARAGRGGFGSGWANVGLRWNTSDISIQRKGAKKRRKIPLDRRNRLSSDSADGTRHPATARKPRSNRAESSTHLHVEETGIAGRLWLAPLEPGALCNLLVVPGMLAHAHGQNCYSARVPGQGRGGAMACLPAMSTGL